MSDSWKIETKTVQCGYNPANGEPRVTPICQSTTYKYDNAQSVADWFDLKAPGHIYTRLTNPTVSVFEAKMAKLEKGVAANGGLWAGPRDVRSDPGVLPAGDRSRLRVRRKSCRETGRGHMVPVLPWPVAELYS